MFADRMMQFNGKLHMQATLPSGIGVLNPFRESSSTLQYADAFYTKYYNDDQKRWAILGINPGRHGGGLTGIPFTDFKRLKTVCGINTNGASSHEPSSEFIYHMIAAMGGAGFFYQQFYINSVCPLGFIIQKENNKWVNYNYYDDKKLYAAVTPFIVESIRRQIDIGLYTEECFCLGKKNTEFLTSLNKEHHFFGTITELPHPRFIVQYKRKQMDEFVDVYVQKLSKGLVY